MPPSASSHTAPVTESFFPDTPEVGASRTSVPGSGVSLGPGLSGPGIPGRRISPYPSSAEEYTRHAPASPEPSTSTAHGSSYRVLREFPSLTLREPAPRLLAPRPFLMHESERSPPSSRVLPPIHSSALESRISTDPYAPPTSSSQLSHSHEPALHHTEYPISAALGIPPPFALQPQPQWDLHSFIPYTRPDFVSFSPSTARRGITGGTRDHFAPHVSPDSAQRREHGASFGEHRSSSSQARPNTLRDMVDISSESTLTRSRHLPSEHPSHPSPTGDGGVRSDGNEPYQDH